MTQSKKYRRIKAIKRSASPLPSTSSPNKEAGNAKKTEDTEEDTGQLQFQSEPEPTLTPAPAVLISSRKIKNGKKLKLELDSGLLNLDLLNSNATSASVLECECGFDLKCKSGKKKKREKKKEESVNTTTAKESAGKPKRKNPVKLQLPEELREIRVHFTAAVSTTDNSTEVNFRGIFNLGNTCYMNCILQVLVHTEPIRKIFLNHLILGPKEEEKDELPASKKRKSSASTAVTTATEPKMEIVPGPMMKEFTELIREFQVDLPQRAEPAAPSDFLITVWEKIEHIATSGQHDAHEFFISFLNVLHLELLKVKETVLEGRERGMNTRRRQAEFKEAVSLSPIDDVFRGRLQSEIVCRACKHNRFTVDPFWDASLEVVGEDKGQGNQAEAGSENEATVLELQDLLKRFTQLEELADDAMLYCPICKGLTKSTKQLSFEMLPPVVCLHLKRFQHTSRSPSKIKTKVSIPDMLDFTPFRSQNAFVGDKKKRARSTTKKASKTKPEQGTSATSKDYSSSNKENWYSLYAVVNHTGTYAGGHYHSYVKKASEWYKCDDAKITVVPREEVLGSEGYLLFYKKSNSNSNESVTLYD